MYQNRHLLQLRYGRYVLWGPVCENHWKNGNKQLIKRGFSMGFAVYSPLALIHAKWAYCSIDVVTYWLVTGISHHNCRADLWWLKVRTSYTHTNLTHLYTRAWSGVGVGETTGNNLKTTQSRSTTIYQRKFLREHPTYKWSDLVIAKKSEVICFCSCREVAQTS